jgi:pyroglutamyl-peptidase
MPILLTGFEPFGSVTRNPSGSIVEHARARPTGAYAGVVAEVLPTAFAAAGERLRALIRTHRPEAILCLGVAAERSAIELERIALNLDDAERPDNGGAAPRGRPIVAEGPVAYRSTLPLAALHAALQAAGFPARFSNHAGTFVCNHAFYVARHEVARLGLERVGPAVPCGLVHVPLPVEAEAAGHGLTLARLIEAIARCLEVLRAGGASARPGLR